jgi:RNA polymerase sigma-70 factor, ECF subfamily
MWFIRKAAHHSDEELMRLMQSEAPGALDELYQRYASALLRYFHRMLWKDANKAQDFLHDLFVKVIENKHRFDASKRFSTWIYSIAHNMCKNEYRRQSFRRSTVGNHVDAVGDRDILEKIIDGEMFRKHLDELLTELSEEDRAAFVFRYEMELPVNEISDILQIPEGTVKSKLFYLKKKIAWKLRSYKTINE